MARGVGVAAGGVKNRHIYDYLVDRRDMSRPIVAMIMMPW